MGTISLATWANLAEIIGAGSIVSGLIFGWIQLRHYRVQQRNAVAVKLAQAFYSHDLAKGLALLQSVPDGIGLKELRSMGSEYQFAAISVVTSFETMGLLTFKHIAPVDVVMDLAGGIVSVMNRKLRTWQKELREEQQQPSWGEWFEWLGDQATKRLADTEPAHVAHRNWVG